MERIKDKVVLITVASIGVGSYRLLGSPAEFDQVTELRATLHTPAAESATGVDISITQNSRVVSKFVVWARLIADHEASPGSGPMVGIAGSGCGGG